MALTVWGHKERSKFYCDWAGYLEALKNPVNAGSFRAVLGMLEELNSIEEFDSLCMRALIDSLCDKLDDFLTPVYGTPGLEERELVTLVRKMVSVALDKCPIWDNNPGWLSNPPTSWKGPTYSGLQTHIAGMHFMAFFGRWSSVVKQGFEIPIRKFLRSILNSSDIGAWNLLERNMLAGALVHNRMYEECVQYNITEAIWHLSKLACYRVVESRSPLRMKVGYNEERLDFSLAMQENPHEWSALQRLLLKSGEMKTIPVVDASSGETNVMVRNAILITAPLASLINIK